MFGAHELKTQFIKVGGKKIHLIEESENLVRYRRDEVERIIKNNGEKLKILPAPATGYGVRLLMIKFKEPLVVPPQDSLTGFIEAPIEIDVKIGELTIDHFIVGKEKYALYGTLEAGVICRYHISPFYAEEPDSLGVAKLTVSNPSLEWESLERVVIPIWKTPMYYESSRAYYPLLIVTIRDNVPYVNNTGKPPKDGLNAVGEVLSLPNFLMRW
ncbi:hypothetical protein X802_09270 [Thermococcus guaymasensis DSM 11113]|uniref:DUF432 domain-containing protein n=1 Tax=Thermococcus guaymasensis DSM 11113 TaxID=1432656 RepID=A0A0X1KM22_9EURY|nr:DUF432 domain-containing protein [Thermococcus guaymasensis]AJC72309.1 hypothetical protein X802_09270 [Thermococcus guaymasensis DSM 11113]